jgi:hypothetical protein
VDIMDEIDAATARLYDTIGWLTDADVRQASLLPGWTRGHVLTHVARGGEALRNVLHDTPADPSGYRTGDWPPAFAALELPEPMRTQRADRLAW